MIYYIGGQYQAVWATPVLLNRMDFRIINERQKKHQRILFSLRISLDAECLSL